MKKILCMVIVTIFMDALWAEGPSVYVENELIIWLEKGVDASTFADISNQGIIPKELLSKRLNIWLFEFTDGKEQGNVRERSERKSNISKHVDVKHVQNNHKNITLRSLTPNDPYYSLQWAPNKVRLPEVWDEFTTGGTTADSDEIVIAVIDDGFAGHQDLYFWRNIHEIPNNWIDDDNNGYIDDYYGWNAVNNTGNITAAEHGTFVSGILGGIGNNNTGICGVNWNVKILSVIGFTPYFITEAMVVSAYSYVLEMRSLYNETDGRSGAFIVTANSSFGIDFGDPADYPIWCSMYDELGQAGILSCAATANGDWNIDQVGDVPTGCTSPFLISVTNTTSADVKNIDAGYGVNSIEIGAPGTDIYSTLPNNQYGYMTGTSMATPQVTGVIALMYAAMPLNMIQAYKNDPGSIALQVKRYLLESADKIPSLNGLVGYGRLNAYDAVRAASCNVNLFFEYISTDKTVLSCGDINAQVVTVTNGAKLTLEAPGSITINGPFSVSAGSKFSASSVD